MIFSIITFDELGYLKYKMKIKDKKQAIAILEEKNLFANFSIAE